MPRGDRTGPMGQGSMTGRRAGYCAGYNMPGFANPIGGYGRGMGYGRGYGRGMGYGRGFGGGRGRGYGYYGDPGYNPGAYPPAPIYPAAAPMDRNQEIDMLKGMADELSASLEEIRKRMQELEKSE